MRFILKWPALLEHFLSTFFYLYKQMQKDWETTWDLELNSAAAQKLVFQFMLA